MPDVRSLTPLLAVMALFVAACGSSSDGDAAPGAAPSPSPASDGAGAEIPSCPAGEFPWQAGAGSTCEPVTADGFDYGEVRSGGPPPDGIPPIDDPSFESIAAGDAWLSDTSPVMALSIDGDQRAYPLAILTWHEIVNDEVGGVPVAVTYCPLCNSGLVFDRRVEGETLDFGTSGRLYRSNLVMYDRQTRTLWSQFTGTGVVGPAYVGTELDRIANSTISWSEFKDAAPDGRVLSRDTGHDRRYGDNPYVGYDDEGSTPFLYRGPEDDRLAQMTRIVGIEEDGRAVAVVREEAAAAGVVRTEVGGREVAVTWSPGTSSALDEREIAASEDIGSIAVFETTTDAGTAVSLATEADGTLRDEDSGTTWDRLGQGVQGPLADESLQPVPFDDTFWFVWFAFQPDTDLVGRLG